MAKPQTHRPGKPLRRDVGGFPLFFDGRERRVITANPWAFADKYIKLYAKEKYKRRACAFVEQARDFFETAHNQVYASRPLLYYYSFLNLSKAILLVRGNSFPAKIKHGIDDPKVNSKKRMRIEGQVVHVPGRAKDKSEFFPEFLTALGAPHLCNSDLKIFDLLRSIPSIHRTYSQVTGETEKLLRIEILDLIHTKDGQNWIKIYFKRGNQSEDAIRNAIEKRRAFSALFTRCSSDKEDHHCYESLVKMGSKRGIDTALKELAKAMQGCGVSGLLVNNGYRYYITNSGPQNFVPNLVATYAIAFYLGSITRYKPQDFDVIVSGSYRWLVEEFLALEPTQFIYQSLSWMTGCEVVQPQALRH